MRKQGRLSRRSGRHLLYLNKIYKVKKPFREDRSMRSIARVFGILFFAFPLVSFMIGISPGFAQESIPQVTAVLTGDNTTKPLVIYYSRSGKNRLAATALKNQLGCEMAEIVSKRSISTGTIMLDQIFNRNDDQEPFSKDLKQYNPIIIMAPIWFTRLSSPARTFIKTQEALKGKDVYIFTTSGGPMSFKNGAIRDFATDYGLIVKGVYNLKGVMKKTQEDFDQEFKALLEKTAIGKGAILEQQK